MDEGLWFDLSSWFDFECREEEEEKGKGYRGTSPERRWLCGTWRIYKREKGKRADSMMWPHPKPHWLERASLWREKHRPKINSEQFIELTRRATSVGFVLELWCYWMRHICVRYFTREMHLQTTDRWTDEEDAEWNSCQHWMCAGRHSVFNHCSYTATATATANDEDVEWKLWASKLSIKPP